MDEHMNVTIPPRTKCPQCGKPPRTWRERPQYGSRELYWIGCCKLLAGGIKPGAAQMSWDREVARWKFDQDIRARA